MRFRRSIGGRNLEGFPPQAKDHDLLLTGGTRWGWSAGLPLVIFVPAMIPADWQPTLTGKLLEMRPLREDDWEALYALARDPLIWEQHPDRERWREARFRVVFREAMESGGALVAVDLATGSPIGFTRYHDYHPERSEIEIGWTFLARSHWGGRYNSEMKDLMVRHAFKFVKTVALSAGVDNLRSRRAIEKLGAVEAGRETNHNGGESVVYHLTTATYKGYGT